MAVSASSCGKQDSRDRRRRQRHALALALAAPMALAAGSGAALDVGISADMESVSVEHDGQMLVVQRNQDRRNTIAPYYAFTSRPCPPFCIQPMNIAPGVETVGELEVLGYLQSGADGDGAALVVDARQPQWTERGMIPGAVNIPWTVFDPGQSTARSIRETLLTRFDVVERDGFLDFSRARTLVLYCNGMWCSQSTNIVHSLLRLGYPAHRLKWYRGGMQSWESVGLSTVRATP